MSSERKGTVDEFTRADGSIYYRVRVRAQDGSRIRDPKPIPAPHDATEASRENYALRMQQREDEKGTLQRQRDKAQRARVHVELPKGGTTLTVFFGKVLEKQEAEGRTSLSRPKSQWNARIAERLGHLPVASITRDQIEDFRDYLDGEVRKRITLGKEHGLAGKSAMNIWSLVCSTLKEAMSSRDRSMRLRADNPCVGIKPPLSSPGRAKTFIYPNEFSKLVACKHVPIEWREAYAIGAYLYLRPNELCELRFKDLSLSTGVVHVSRAWDEEKEAKKKLNTKSAAGVRDVPIEPALLPLLTVMYNRRTSDEDLLLPVLREQNEDFRADTIREHLRKAGCDRARLFEETNTMMQVNFRSLRDSGITWLFLKATPTPVERAQRRAGHKSITTTLDYAKAVEDLAGHFGAPFGKLPFAPPGGGSGGSTMGQVAAVKLETSEKETWNECEGRELNPYRNNPART